MPAMIPGNEIKRAREALGLDLDDHADLLGIALDTLVMWESYGTLTSVVSAPVQRMIDALSGFVLATPDEAVCLAVGAKIRAALAGKPKDPLLAVLVFLEYARGRKDPKVLRGASGDGEDDVA